MDQDLVMDASPSRTAVMAAVERGRHRLEDSFPWVLDDPLALVIVGPKWEITASASRIGLPDEIGRQVRASLVVRSRYAEDRLLAGHFRQYVLLGAGLDSFAWRRPDLLGPLRLYEVDHPASQEWKRQRVGELGLPSSDHHVFAPIDFEVESLLDGLRKAGFDPAAPTLFSWLGVIPYLTTNAAESTLRTVAGCRSGSEIAFEYGVPPECMDRAGRQFAEIFSPIATTVREPVHTTWTPGQAEEVVVRCGLRVVDHPTRDDLVHQYFAGRPDHLEPWTVSRLLTAAVP